MEKENKREKVKERELLLRFIEYFIINTATTTVLISQHIFFIFLLLLFLSLS